MIRVQPSFFIMKNNGKGVRVGIDLFNNGNEQSRRHGPKIGRHAFLNESLRPRNCKIVADTI